MDASSRSEALSIARRRHNGQESLPASGRGVLCRRTVATTAATRRRVRLLAPVRKTPWRVRLRQLAGHRLLHFIVLGAAIFAVAPRPDTARDIALDRVTLTALEQAEAQRLGAPVLSPEQRATVAQRFLEDELLYREALRLGFDRNDAVVRQRLVQKVLFLAEDLVGVSRPATEEDLRAFYDATRAQWTKPATVSLVHVYAG